MKLTILRLMRMLTWGMAIQEIQNMNITNQLNNEQAAKLAAKAEDVSGTSAIPSSPEPIDGKRHITYQMEKNRGLTWKHKKQTKNRRKYKEQRKKKVNCQKGQVQEIKKHIEPYCGEASGINVATRRVVRFKN
uniref:Sas10 C-terminal domain-containing protein n=1 Tax=Quercus lobata TaxID=97700 RepID=A0A7N2MU39_QUELO